MERTMGNPREILPRSYHLIKDYSKLTRRSNMGQGLSNERASRELRTCSVIWVGLPLYSSGISIETGQHIVPNIRMSRFF